MTESKEEVITIQKTSKRLKLQYGVAKVLIVLGIWMIFMPIDNGRVWGCLMALAGFFHLGVTRLRIWWNHK